MGINTSSSACRGRWLVLVILAFTLAAASVAGIACASDGTVLSDNSSVTTVTEPSGYIQVEIRPAEIVAETGQQVHVECSIRPLVRTPVNIVSVELALFDSDGALLRKQESDADWQQAGLVRYATYRILGDEAFFKLFIVFDVGKILDQPGERYSEYTVAPVPMTIME